MPRVLYIIILIGTSVAAQVPKPGDIRPPEPMGFKPVTVNGAGIVSHRAPAAKDISSTSVQGAMLPTVRNQQSIDEVKAIIIDAGWSTTAVSYELPSHSSRLAAKPFFDAFAELRAMLEGRDTTSIKRAVYLVEHAYEGNTMSYPTFCAAIDVEVGWVRIAIEQSGMEENPTTLRHALHRFFAETLQSGAAKHYPYRYDHTDIWGENDHSKLFVSKLFRTGSGQCHSLPLAYKILAEELGLQAWLAFSPEHSYIQFQDERERWHNFELTNGNLVSDSWILASGYIKAEALRSGIYMDTIGSAGSIAYCLIDLAKSYSARFGVDGFVEQCAILALRYDPHNIHAWLLLSDYETMLTLYILRQIGNYPEEFVRDQYPRAFAHVVECRRIYAIVDGTGYLPMPKEEYQSWLGTTK